MVSTSISYNLIASDLTRSIKQVSEQPNVARETEYYLANIGNVKTPDDLVNDSRLLNYALKAHGLEEMAYAKAFIKKILVEGIAKDDAFANQLADSRYEKLAETFNFEAYGTATTSFARTQQPVADLYMRQTLEEDAGSTNEGVRLALYFERKAPELSSVYEILAEPALGTVVRTALGFDSSLAAVDIDKQAELIKSRLDIADFQDSDKLSEFIQRFTALWELENPSAGSNDIANLFSGSTQSGISADVLLSINTLKLGG